MLFRALTHPLLMRPTFKAPFPPNGPWVGDCNGMVLAAIDSDCLPIGSDKNGPKPRHRFPISWMVLDNGKTHRAWHLVCFGPLGESLDESLDPPTVRVTVNRCFPLRSSPLLTDNLSTSSSGYPSGSTPLKEVEAPVSSILAWFWRRYTELESNHQKSISNASRVLSHHLRRTLANSPVIRLIQI